MSIGGPLDRYQHEHFNKITEALEAGVPLVLFAGLDVLTDEQRLYVFRAYCSHCGQPHPGCQCWNDE